MDKRYLLIGLIIIFLLAACGATDNEQEPDLVLPTAVISEAATPVAATLVATATFQSTVVIFPETPTPPVADTPEPVPTPTALPPTLIPSDAVVETGNRPFVSQDLLYIGAGELRRWSHQDGRVTTLLYTLTSGRRDVLVGEVHRFAINAEGTVAVAARAIPTDSLNSELWWVDVVSGERRQLAANVPGIIDLALSPDGRSLLYVASDVDNPFLSGTVYYLDLAGGGGATAVGPCTDEPAETMEPPVQGACLGVRWTRDSQNMLWSDARGIWLRHLNANEPTLILPVVAEAGAVLLPLYHLRDWSLNGRYLLLSVVYFERTETAVLDLVTNELITLPGATVSVNTGYRVVDWMQDDRLFVMRERDEQGQVAPTLQLWRLTDGQFVLEETTALQLPPHNWLQDGVHFITGRFAFTLLADDPLAGGLYLMASSNEPPQRVNGFPFLNGKTVWLDDNAGAIVTMPARDDAYVFLGVEPGEGVVYEIRPFLGDHASDFTWLPPKPQKKPLPDTA